MEISHADCRHDYLEVDGVHAARDRAADLRLLSRAEVMFGAVMCLGAVVGAAIGIALAKLNKGTKK